MEVNDGASSCGNGELEDKTGISKTLGIEKINPAPDFPVTLKSADSIGECSQESSLCRIEKVEGNYSNENVESYDDKVKSPAPIYKNLIPEGCLETVHQSLQDSSSKVTLKRKSDSLALITSYDINSDSENESNKAFKIPQGPTDLFETSSESDSESGSIFNVESDASDELSQSSEDGDVAEGTSDEAAKKSRSSRAPPSNRVLSCLDIGDLPPIKDLHISVKEEECLPFGKVYSIVETLVVIESLPDVPALNLDSVLFTKVGEALGEVFDVFGPVKRPYYTLRFNTRKEIEEKSLSIGTTVYCAPKTKYTQYVFIHQLARLKGSDASWKNDQEPPIECLDYSDDEQERHAKKAIREAKQKTKAAKVIDVDAPPKKISSFEERMNQRNTLRNQMFIKDLPMDNRSKDWFRATLGRREDEPGPTGGGGGGVMIRSPAFTPPQFQRPPQPPCTFLPFDGGPRFSRFIPPFSPPCQGGNIFMGGRPIFAQPMSNCSVFPNQSNNSFSHSQPGSPFGGRLPHPIGPPPGAMTRPPPTSSNYAMNNFNQDQKPSFPFDRQSPFQQRPEMCNRPFFQSPPHQFPPHSPSFQFGRPVFPQNQPGCSRPLQPNSPPYFGNNPFACPPNHSIPNQNINYPNNRFSNSACYSPFSRFNQNQTNK